jgi:transposase-like protein
MPGSHALFPGPPLGAIDRPRCPHCQTRTMLSRIAPGPAGYQLHAFACPKCDGVHRTLVVSDPMSGDARGWLSGELRSPD